MAKLQFRILYREFLFRVVDLELLSSHALGDSSKILGQFGALLIFTSILLCVLAIVPGMQYFLIATTMLAVGLFAVMSWDSTFPSRRDVLVLAPLPVRTRTLLLAKVAASASAVGVTILTLNGLPSLMWTLAAAPRNLGLLGLMFSPAVYRSFAAYWITMLSAGGFIFGSLLCVQGLASQLLPRRQFLRASSLLQMAAFCLLVSVYVLQPFSAWLPSYWFLGLLQQLKGSMHPALVPLARRAWIALAIAGSGTAAIYSMSYFRTLRKIVEEPDITPGSRRGSWLPNFGAAFPTAVTQFSLRTLLRSRQHRLILAFYLGIGFAMSIVFLKTPLAQRMNVPLLTADLVMMIAWIAGTRVVFSMPVDLGANWIFRVTPIRGAPACLAARRRVLSVLAVAPVWAGSTAVFLSVWPWKLAVGHLLIVGLLAMALMELCLRGAQKLPFTCSYLPGKSNVHITFWFCILWLTMIVGKAAEYERRALENPSFYGAILIGLAVITILARLHTQAEAREEGAELRFEEEPMPAVAGLGLNHSAR